MVMFGLLAMLGFLAVPVLVAYTAIAPLHRRAKGRGRKITIQVIDIMSLLVLVQVVLAFCVAITRERFDNGLIPAFVLLSILLLVLWWAGVDVLSQLGIRQTSRRLTMHLALLPGVCAIMIGTAASLALIGNLLMEITSPAGFSESAAELLLYSFVAVTCVVVGVWLLRSMGTWIARGESEVVAK